MTTTSINSNRDGQREVLAAHLRQSDARCPVCRYALRGSSGDRCPECGTALALAVVVRHPMSTWWLAGLIGAAISSATALMVEALLIPSAIALLHQPTLQQMVAAGVAPSTSLPRWNVLAAVMVLALLSCLMLAFFIARRRQFSA